MHSPIKLMSSPFITATERERSKGVGCEKWRERRKGKSAKSKNTTEEHCADAIDHQIRSECQNGLLNIYRREMDEWRGKNDVFLRWNDWGWTYAHKTYYSTSCTAKMCLLTRHSYILMLTDQSSLSSRTMHFI